MPGRHEINVQDGFLFQSLKESRALDVVLVSGKRYEGARLKRFYRFAIIVEADGQERLIYKHAIDRRRSRRCHAISELGRGSYCPSYRFHRRPPATNGALGMMFENCPSVRALLLFAEGSNSRSIAGHLLSFVPAEDGHRTSEVAAHVKTCTVCAGFIEDVISLPDIEPPPGWQLVTDDDVVIGRDVLRLRTGGHLTGSLLIAYYQNKLTAISVDLVQEHLVACKVRGCGTRPPQLWGNRLGRFRHPPRRGTWANS